MVRSFSRSLASAFLAMSSGAALLAAVACGEAPVATTAQRVAVEAFDSYYGLPPPAPHVTSADCGLCHTGYTATSLPRARAARSALPRDAPGRRGL